MMREKYVFSKTLRAPYNYLTVGDWVVFDNDIDDPTAIIGKVIAFESQYENHITVVIRCGKGESSVLKRRSFSDIPRYMKKIINFEED